MIVQVGVEDQHARRTRRPGTVNRPSLPTGITGSMPSRSVTILSSSPKAPAVCTSPVPSVVVTNSAATTRKAFSWPA